MKKHKHSRGKRDADLPAKPKTPPVSPTPASPHKPLPPMPRLEKGWQHYVPTPEIQEELCRYIRSGAFPEVAAEALGIPARWFDRWMRRSLQARVKRRVRNFGQAMRQAIAHARLAAETAAFTKDKLAWLKSGPGRDSARRVGWSNPISLKPDAAVEGVTTETLLEVCQKLLELLDPFPEAKTLVADWLSREFKMETGDFGERGP